MTEAFKGKVFEALLDCVPEEKNVTDDELSDYARHIVNYLRDNGLRIKRIRNNERSR